MSFNFNTNIINKNTKNKWINEYEKLNQNLKDEELNLLKLFLVQNYHLNKSYKKYVYKEILSNNLYYENNYKKIRASLDDIIKLKDKDNFINNSELQKKKQIFQNLFLSIKNESNKKYDLLLKEEKQVENDLTNFDKKSMEEYDKEIEKWINNNNIKPNNISNNSSILVDNINRDYDKEDISVLFNLIDKKNEKNIKYRTIDNLKKYKSENHKNDISSKKNNNYENRTKNKHNLIGNLNIKKNNDNIIRLTTAQIPTKFIDFFDNTEDPLEKYFDFIINEIESANNINFANSGNNNSSKKQINNYNLKNNLINEEKNLINKIYIFVKKLFEDNKSINYLKTKIKYINSIIKDKMDGIYLGWGESEHNEFLILKNFYKEKSNTFIFLTSLNNIFPYMHICELKKHIKLYEIYLKIEKIKKILIDKYTQIKNKCDFDKSRISKQTSTSVTKSTSSIKIKRFYTSSRKNKMSIDFVGNSFKTFLYNTNSKFFNNNKNKIDYKSDEYLKTNYNRNSRHHNNINAINRFRKSKEKFICSNKNYSSISLNNSKNKSLNYSYNIYRKGKIRNFYKKYENKILLQ